MDWTNKIYFTAVVCFVLTLLYVNATLASDVLWRVQSDAENKDIIPAYERSKTPFPVKEKPKEDRKVQNDFEISQEELRKQQEMERRSLLASDVLAQIRVLLEEGDVFNPDITRSKVDGLIVNENGAIALVDNVWMAEGDVIKVPIFAKDKLLDLVKSLEYLDAGLASLVKQDIEAKLEETKTLELTIDRIEQTTIYLKDSNQQQHVINFKLDTSSS